MSAGGAALSEAGSWGSSSVSSSALGSDVPTAGWYADPQDAQRIRWWDGTQWTTHVVPHPHVAGAPAVSNPQAGYSPRPPGSGNVEHQSDVQAEMTCQSVPDHDTHGPSPEVSVTAQNYCTYCGVGLLAGARFCAACGNQING